MRKEQLYLTKYLQLKSFWVLLKVSEKKRDAFTINTCNVLQVTGVVPLGCLYSFSLTLLYFSFSHLQCLQIYARKYLDILFTFYFLQNVVGTMDVEIFALLTGVYQAPRRVAGT